MLSILTSGLSLEGKELLQEAITLVYGEDSAEIIELNKDDLRQQVRLSSKSVATPLVILDGVSMDYCKDIENGLYSSTKFYQYTDEASLVEFFSSKFGVSLSVQTSGMEVTSVTDVTASQSIIESYEIQLGDKNQLISHLNARLLELNHIIEDGDYAEKEDSACSKELEQTKQENLDLRSKLSSITSESKLSSDELMELRKERDSLAISVEKLELKRESILADLSSVSVELTEYKLKYSTQSGLLRSIEFEVENLKGKVVILEGKESSIEVLKKEKLGLEKDILRYSTESSKLKAELAAAESELVTLKANGNSVTLNDSEKSLMEDKLSQLSVESVDLTKNLLDLKGSLTSAEGTLLELQGRLDTVTSERDALRVEIGNLEGKLKSSDDSLMQLNKEKIEMQGRLDLLERSTRRDTGIEDLVKEIAELRQKYDSISGNVFNKIASLAMPKVSTKVSLIHFPISLQKVKFVFAGSTESRKGCYKCLLSELKKAPKTEKFLLVDVVSETAVDYVFEINPVAAGVDWFRKGGGVQPYLSKTCLPNVSVLSPGLGYINDSYFLTIDWQERLKELEESGYNVILFCGDISNIIGRVLHESFASLAESRVYIHGNSVGSRTIVSNLKGISNSNKSIICYFEYNPQVSRFMDLVQKTNVCEILSTS